MIVQYCTGVDFPVLCTHRYCMYRVQVVNGCACRSRPVCLPCGWPSMTDSVGSILNAEVRWAFYKNTEQESQNGGVAGKFPPTQQYLSVFLHMWRPGLFWGTYDFVCSKKKSVLFRTTDNVWSYSHNPESDFSFNNRKGFHNDKFILKSSPE